MKIQARPIEEIENGVRKYVGLDVLVKHNGKTAVWRTHPANPQSITSIVNNLDKMVQALGKQFPELLDSNVKQFKAPAITKNLAVEAKRINKFDAQKQGGKLHIGPVDPSVLAEEEAKVQAMIKAASKKKPIQTDVV